MLRLKIKLKLNVLTSFPSGSLRGAPTIQNTSMIRYDMSNQSFLGNSCSTLVLFYQKGEASAEKWLI